MIFQSNIIQLDMDRVRIITLLLSLVMVMSAAGCEEEKGPGSHYDDTLISAHERGKAVAGRTTLKGIQDAIRAYYASNGEYPASLDDLPELMSSPIDTSLYDYNPENGTITLLE
jgi:hypothetical protein